MPNGHNIESLLKGGSTAWNRLRQAGKIPREHTGATLVHLFSANADLSGLDLVGTEWEKCDLSKVSFRDSDLSNAYFHGGRLQECDFRGCNLDGATFEQMKLVRCDFSGAKGLDNLELQQVDLDRVIGLGGEPTAPKSAQAPLEAGSDGQLPFRPQDPSAALVSRGLKAHRLAPAWVLDVPGLRLPVEVNPPTGASLEPLYREAVRARLSGRSPFVDPDATGRAQAALRLGSRESPFAALYLNEAGAEPLFRFSAARSLRAALRAEIDIDDATAALDPRTSGALLVLRLPHEAADFLGEARRRLAAAHLFTSLLEAGFTPEHNWDEAIESSERAQELVATAGLGVRKDLEDAFRAFSVLPEEVRLRRLAYLAESVSHLEALSRLPPGIEPPWLAGPETRECHEREMTLVQALRAREIPEKVAALASSELGVAPGAVPEDSEDDLFIHVRCAVCGREKLLVQSPEQSA
ncbi:MAG TPA: pentapeptide repeat-containing protein [Myxococcaceae bacterium]|nr:pentapeptide repeat-containing protein [Myxococcaceae bacterium]